MNTETTNTKTELEKMIDNVDAYITIDEDGYKTKAWFDAGDVHEAYVSEITEIWFDDDGNEIEEISYQAISGHHEESFENLATAVAWLKDEILDTLHDMVAELDSEADLLETADEYWVITRSLWAGDSWKAITSTNDEAEANSKADIAAHDGWTQATWDAERKAWWTPTQNLKNVVNSRVVKKSELAEYGIKISDAMLTVADYRKTAG